MTNNTKLFSEINNYIKTRSTGCPDEFTDKLGISKSTLTRCLHYMRKHKAPIRYDYFTKTYYYEEVGSFVIEFRHD